jgi:GNAT superfamily N-acetyltransferase
MIMRSAARIDLATLSALAVRSKAHWGYDEAFMAACADELAVPESALASEVVRLCEGKGARIAGFYRLERCTGSASGMGSAAGPAEIEGFFVDPRFIGRGVGRVLWNDLLRQALAHGISGIICQSDLNAAGFYESMGMRRTGMRPSASIPDRELPVLELEIDGISG